jgi:hypothetical protein
MAKLGISTGTTPNDGLGDNLLGGAIKINSNFSEIYTRFGDGNNLTAIGGTWVTTAAGIHTLKNVGIGTTNPRFKLEVGAVGSSGTTLFVNGDARVTGIVTIGPASITLNGITNIINVGTGITINGSTGVIQATSVVVGGTTLTGAAVTSITAGSGISVNQSTGNVTITATGGGGGTSSQWTTTAAGIHTLSNVGIGTTNPTSALTVKGNTSLETLSVSGVSTFAGITTVTGPTLFTKQLSVSGVSTFNYDVNFIGQTYDVFWDESLYQGCLKFTDNASLVFGNSDAFRIYYSNNITKFDGTMLLTGGFSVEAPVGSGQTTIARFGMYSGGTGGHNVELYHNSSRKFETIGAGVTVTGTTFTNQLSVSGVSTLTSNVSVGGTISIDGGVKLTTNNVTIVGTSGTVGEIKRIGGAPFFYDGSAWREFVLSTGTPVSVPADTEWDSVILRSTYNTGTNFDDAKFEISPVYVGTGATTVGSPLKYGTKSLRLDGSVGCGISYAPRTEYDFTASWTIEFWVYYDSSPDSTYGEGSSLVSMISLSDVTKNWIFGTFDNGGNTFFSWDNENNATSKTLYTSNASAFDSLFLNQWRHLAVVREDDGSLHLYIDGTESSTTTGGTVFDNNIVQIASQGLHIGGSFIDTINALQYNSIGTFDGFIDDLRISAGVGTAGQRYNSIGISTYATFTPPTTELPTTGTLSSYVQPPGDKYGEIGLGTSPTWRGTSGVTVSQQSSGNYRVSFASTYTNSNDYFVLSHAMDQGFASYVGIARSTTHVDFAINKESDNAVVNTGSLSVQIKNHL